MIVGWLTPHQTAPDHCRCASRILAEGGACSFTTQENNRRETTAEAGTHRGDCCVSLSGICTLLLFPRSPSVLVGSCTVPWQLCLSGDRVAGWHKHGTQDAGKCLFWKQTWTVEVECWVTRTQAESGSTSLSQKGGLGQQETAPAKPFWKVTSLIFFCASAETGVHSVREGVCSIPGFQRIAVCGGCAPSYWLPACVCVCVLLFVVLSL